MPIPCLEMQLKNRCRLYFLLFVCMTVFLPAPLFAAEECSGCHEEVKAKSRRGRVVHAPVMKGQCSQCHIAGKVVAAPVKKSTSAAEKEKSDKVRWVQTSSSRELVHWLRLPAEKLSAGLYLKATDGRMRSPVVKVVMPSRGDVAQLTDDATAPRQTNLLLTDVRRGISTTATLQWETDEHTESFVYYGVGNLRSVKTERDLARKHSLVLLGLESDKVYQYQVVSRDIFGHETSSPVGEFSTEKSFWEQGASYEAANPFAAEPELSWELRQVEDDYLLIVKADRSVSLSLGVENKKKSKATEEREVAASGRFSHPILKSSFDTNITVCKTCHQSQREEYSHPIKVRARQGMVIPPEYPVLADGTMSCMTCHDSHASNHDYRLRKSKKSDLCRGCHRNY